MLDENDILMLTLKNEYVNVHKKLHNTTEECVHEIDTTTSKCYSKV